ncbi:hypothetical protein K438DRAFT_1953101 [Mycena galopus ATCC 62051]|nr:hypothetical protein K438DRAFT_1953101 [Mycena galopus ATCC 62051]
MRRRIKLQSPRKELLSWFPSTSLTRPDLLARLLALQHQRPVFVVRRSIRPVKPDTVCRVNYVASRIRRPIFHPACRREPQEPQAARSAPVSPSMSVSVLSRLRLLLPLHVSVLRPWLVQEFQYPSGSKENVFVPASTAIRPLRTPRMMPSHIPRLQSAHSLLIDPVPVPTLVVGAYQALKAFTVKTEHAETRLRAKEMALGVGAEAVSTISFAMEAHTDSDQVERPLANADLVSNSGNIDNVTERDASSTAPSDSRAMNADLVTRSTSKTTPPPQEDSATGIMSAIIEGIHPTPPSNCWFVLPTSNSTSSNNHAYPVRHTSPPRSHPGFVNGVFTGHQGPAATQNDVATDSEKIPLPGSDKDDSNTPGMDWAVTELPSQDPRIVMELNFLRAKAKVGGGAKADEGA